MASNANAVYNPEGAESLKPGEKIQAYKEQFAGEETDVKDIPYPKPDQQWFNTLTWLLRGVDAQTIQFGDPDEYTDAESDVVVLHESNGSQVLTYVGDEQMTLASTRLADNLDVTTTASGMTISFDDGTRKAIDVTNGNGISLSTSGSGKETELRAVNGADEVRLEFISDAGEVTELITYQKDGVGGGGSSDSTVHTPAKIAVLDMTPIEIMTDDSIDLVENQMVYSLPRNNGYVNVPSAPRFFVV